MNKQRIETILNIPPEQHGRTWLLFLFSFGMSGAYVCARSEADAMFLTRVGVDRLPAMILVAASAVAILTAVYSRLVVSMSLRKVILSTHFLLAGVTLGLGLLVQAGFESPAVPEVLYLIAELRGALGSIFFATLLNEMFPRSAPASVSGVAGSGSTLAGIVLGGTVGVLAAWLGATSVLFLIPVLDLLAGAVATRCPGRVRGAEPGLENGASESDANSATRLSQTPLVRYLSIIVAFKSIVVLMIEFQWKSSAGRFFGSEDELASFFGIFYAALFLLTGLLQLFGTSRLLTRAGLRFGLAAFPGCLVLVLSGAVISAGTYIFWWLTAARGCDTVRRGVTDPAINVLYWPLKSDLRRQAIALNGGWVKPISEAITALLLIPLAGRLTDRHLAIAIVALSLIWLAAIFQRGSNIPDSTSSGERI